MAGTPRSAAASTWAAAVQRGGYFCSHCCAGAEASSGCAGRSWGLNRRITSRLGRLAVGCAGVERLLESLLLALGAAVADDLPTGLDALVAERPLDGVDVARGRPPAHRGASLGARSAPGRWPSSAALSPNTVHLMLLRYPLPVVQPGGTNGTNGCGASQGEPDHGLHQPRGVEHDDPADRGERSLGGVESAEYPSTGLARARDGLLRGRVGALHAVVVPRGLALPAGRPAVVERPVGTPPGGGQVGYLASPDALGCRTAASLA